MLSPNLIRALKKLSPNKTRETVSPHKIALVLAIANLYEEGFLVENHVPISPELVATFYKMGDLVAPDYKTKLRIELPLFHLQDPELWQLHPAANIHNALTSKNSPKGFKPLLAVVDYGTLSPQLYHAMLDPIAREEVRHVIVSEFFPSALFRFSDVNKEVKPYLDLVDQAFLGKVADLPSTWIETEVRGSKFKQQVPKLYNYQCAISGYKMATTQNASLLDACHIQPWSVNHLDTIQNGICLSPMLHRAFDRKLISVSEDYRVIVSSDFIEIGSSPHSILQFKDQKLHLPADKAHWPDQALLSEHRRELV